MNIFEELSNLYESDETGGFKVRKLKEIKLDPIDDYKDANTKKIYSYLVSISEDKKYSASNKKTELYTQVYNQFHEWPDFMQTWIKEEYVHLQALKATNLTLNTHKNNYPKQLSRIVNDLNPGETKKSIDSLLDKLESGQIYVDKSFFDSIKYAMRQSPLTVNESSKLAILLDEWSDLYNYLLAEKKKKIQLQF
jgi:hypothetical protein